MKVAPVHSTEYICPLLRSFVICWKYWTITAMIESNSQNYTPRYIDIEDHEKWNRLQKKSLNANLWCLVLKQSLVTQTV